MEQEARPANLGTWVITPRPRPLATMRLLCLPYAGGGASAYVPWVRHLPEWIELRAVALPGREKRSMEDSVRTMDDYLTPIVSELLADRTLPLAIFGHSMGAVAGHELALRLAESGYPPKHLILSGRAFPTDLPAVDPLYLRTDKEFLEVIRRDFGGLPEELDEFPEILQYALELVRNDLEILECFQPRFTPPLDLPVTLLWSEADSSLTPAMMLRWREITRGDVAYYTFPGDHFYLIERASEVVQCIVNRIAIAGRV